MSRLYRLVLPTTGYIALHTTQADGEPPLRATCLFGGTSDDDARRWLADEVASLTERAPSDVLHTIQVCERTDEGCHLVDRVIDSATVRGHGLPLSECRTRGRLS